MTIKDNIIIVAKAVEGNTSVNVKGICKLFDTDRQAKIAIGRMVELGLAIYVGPIDIALTARCHAALIDEFSRPCWMAPNGLVAPRSKELSSLLNLVKITKVRSTDVRPNKQSSRLI